MDFKPETKYTGPSSKPSEFDGISFNSDFEHEAPQSSTSQLQTHLYLPVQPNFNEASIRLGFIRKVYGIFTVQIFCTLCLIALVNLVEEIRCWAKENLLTCIGLSFAFAFIIFIIFSYNKRLVKLFPINFILLGIFTLFLGFGTAVLTTLIDGHVLLYASATLLCPCLVVVLFTGCQSKIDLKWYMHLLLVIVIAGLTSIIFYLTLPPEDPQVMIICSVTSLVIGIYLAMFTQALMSGSCCQFRPENYVAASLSAYTIIIGIFLIALLILALIGGDSSSGDCGGAGGGGGGSHPHGCSVFYCGTCMAYEEDAEEDERRRQQV